MTSFNFNQKLKMKWTFFAKNKQRWKSETFLAESKKMKNIPNKQ